MLHVLGFLLAVVLAIAWGLFFGGIGASCLQTLLRRKEL